MSGADYVRPGAIRYFPNAPADLSDSGPDVAYWPMDRPRVASQNDDPEMIGLALLYPARKWNCCVPGHHGYPRALDLIRVSAPKAIRAT